MPARSAEAKQAQNLIRAAPALPVGGLGPDTVHSEARQEVLGGGHVGGLKSTLVSLRVTASICFLTLLNRFSDILYI